MLKSIEEMIKKWKHDNNVTRKAFKKAETIENKIRFKAELNYIRYILSDLEELKKLREKELTKELSKNKLRNDVEGI
jgi:hypothetical protein